MIRFIDIAGYPHPTLKEPNYTPIVIISASVVLVVAIVVIFLLKNKNAK